MPESTQLREFTATELIEEQDRGTLVLDTRPAEQFAALHIQGSVQISLAGHFAAWAAILINPRQKLILIARDAKDAQEALVRLTRVGLDRVAGFALADEEGWRESGIELGSISTLTCENIGAVLEDAPRSQLVDVRSRAEWLQGHLPGAISLPLLELDSKARSIDPVKTSIVYCHEGYRATTAASILLRERVGDVGILIDGVEGWSAHGLPLELPGPK